MAARAIDGEFGESMSDERFDQRMVARVQPLLDDEQLADLDALDVATLRAKRDAFEVEEHRVSYARRILQGRIDVLRAEAARRSDGTTAGVLERLSDVLADQGTRAFDPATTRPPSSVQPAELEDDVDVEGPADVSGLDDQALHDLADRYARQEAALSGLRRRLFDVIDRLQAAIADRYRTGAASVSELLAGD